MNDAPHPDIDLFIHRLRTGELTSAEIEDMERALLADPELRRGYRSAMRMEASLLHTWEEQLSEDVPPIMPLPSPKPGFWSKRTMAGLAAGLLMGVGLWALISRSETPPVVATLENQSHARWASPGVHVTGQPMEAREWYLLEGLADIRFDSGVLLSLEGPARLELVDPMRCRLKEGDAVIDVPEPARGFVVESPGGYAVDHGTRFAVQVDGTSQQTDFQVLEGHITVHHPESGAEMSLIDQEGSQLSPAGLAKREAHLFWEAREVASANTRTLSSWGRERCVMRHTDLDKSHYLDPKFLMVKRDRPNDVGDSAFPSHFPKDRRSLIGFDLSNIPLDKVRSTSLHLNLAPTGLGYSTYLPDTVTFEVYGVLETEHSEQWNQDGLRWNDAPGGIRKSPEIDPSEVRLLAQVEIPKGRTSGPVVFESETLDAFVRADRTGKVDFLLVRATEPLDAHSLVHAFASSSHPLIAGPSLIVELESSEDQSTLSGAP